MAVNRASIVDSNFKSWLAEKTQQPNQPVHSIPRHIDKIGSLKSLSQWWLQDY